MFVQYAIREMISPHKGLCLVFYREIHYPIFISLILDRAQQNRMYTENKCNYCKAVNVSS